eukprot:GHUV01027299.1.p1 GENE.GHUV01027299.1~~GHUV01027299.1.p1  ORF type:complete len:173 (+),score=29.42 GHUV01027299.1:551-1069(+)
MLGSLLQAALMSGQQQQAGVEVPGVPPLPGQVAPVSDVAQQQASAAVPTQGTEGEITASQLQLTQLVGSAGDQQVLLNQPKAHIIARARMPRGDRLVSNSSSCSALLCCNSTCGPCIVLASNRAAVTASHHRYARLKLSVAALLSILAPTLSLCQIVIPLDASMHKRQPTGS